jgi:hypothetical protein
MAAILVGVLLIGVVLLDAFETLVLPRRVDRSFRLVILFYRLTWWCWTGIVKRVPSPHWREALLGGFGPASLLLLLGIWASGLIVGFALLQWGLSPAVNLDDTPQVGLDFTTALYLSGATFFTLGYGDVSPVSPPARALAVLEGGIGFTFLALVIGYLPALTGPLAQRELMISLLDARAGSPPSAAEVLRRYAGPSAHQELYTLLGEWERWAAMLLESHLSYPVLAYFRSQHEHHSWVAALTTVLDTSLVLSLLADDPLAHQARLTFATANHAAHDLGKIFEGRHQASQSKREPLASEDLDRICETARQALAPSDLPTDQQIWPELARLRNEYETYVEVLAAHLRMPLPSFMPPPSAPHTGRFAR